MNIWNSPDLRKKLTNYTLRSNSSRIFFKPANNVMAAALQADMEAKKVVKLNISSVK